MKSYKQFEKTYIGDSDIAALVLVGCDKTDVVARMLNFGEDGTYKAYVDDSDTEIGNHYNKICSFNHWLKIYDDDGCTAEFKADLIIVYRAGEMGCIIQLVNDDNKLMNELEDFLNLFPF